MQALEEAVRVGVLEERERVGGAEYRFAHAFFRQTLYEEISVPRRLQLHQRVGRALEAQYGARVADHAAELADHFAHSSDPADLGKAVQYGEMAGQRATSVFAYGEAARLLYQTIEVQEVLDPDDKARRCDLLLAFAEALGPAGEPRRVAEEIASEAFALAEQLGDSERAGRAAELGLEALRRFASGAAGVVPLWAQWAERLDRHAAPDTARQARADAAIAQIHMQSGRWSEAWRLLDRALAAARQAGDAEGLFRTATSTTSGWVSPRRWPSALDLARELRRLPRGGASQQTFAQFLDYAAGNLMAAGEREPAEELRREIESLAAHMQDADLLLKPLLYHAVDTFLDGDLEGAVEAGRAILVRAEELGSPVAGPGSLMQGAFRPLLYLGRAEEALTLVGAIREMTGATGQSLFHLGSRLLAMAQMGRVAEARTALQEAIARFSITPEEDDTPIRILLGLLETAVVVGDREAAALLAPKLADVTGMSPPLTCASLHVARAFAFLGDRAAARVHYERALEWTGKMRHRPELALARLGLAELLLDEARAPTPTAHPEPVEQLGEAGERATARPPLPLGEDKGVSSLRAEALGHLDFAIEELRAMKMQPALERALRRKGLLQA